MHSKESGGVFLESSTMSTRRYWTLTVGNAYTKGGSGKFVANSKIWKHKSRRTTEKEIDDLLVRRWFVRPDGVSEMGVKIINFSALLSVMRTNVEKFWWAKTMKVNVTCRTVSHPQPSMNITNSDADDVTFVGKRECFFQFNCTPLSTALIKSD